MCKTQPAGLETPSPVKATTVAPDVINIQNNPSTSLTISSAGSGFIPNKGNHTTGFGSSGSLGVVGGSYSSTFGAAGGGGGGGASPPPSYIGAPGTWGVAYNNFTPPVIAINSFSGPILTISSEGEITWTGSAAKAASTFADCLQFAVERKHGVNKSAVRRYYHRACKNILKKIQGMEKEEILDFLSKEVYNRERKVIIDQLKNDE